MLINKQAYQDASSTIHTNASLIKSNTNNDHHNISEPQLNVPRKREQIDNKVQLTMKLVQKQSYKRINYNRQSLAIEKAKMI
jgi:hypothetical protein